MENCNIKPLVVENYSIKDIQTIVDKKELQRIYNVEFKGDCRTAMLLAIYNQMECLTSKGTHPKSPILYPYFRTTKFMGKKALKEKMSDLAAKKIEYALVYNADKRKKDRAYSVWKIGRELAEASSAGNSETLIGEIIYKTDNWDKEVAAFIPES